MDTLKALTTVFAMACVIVGTVAFWLKLATHRKKPVSAPPADPGTLRIMYNCQYNEGFVVEEMMSDGRWKRHNWYDTLEKARMEAQYLKRRNARETFPGEIVEVIEP